MASGKTSIGKKLAKKLEYNFLDLDDFIEDIEKQSGRYQPWQTNYFAKKQSVL